MFFLPLPLMSTQQLSQYSPFELDERFLDLAEIYSLLRTGNISSLYPDSCTKLVTFFYKDIPDGKNIFKMFGETVQGHTCLLEIHHNRTFTMKRFINHDFVISDDKTIVTNTFIIISLDEGDFGHYCGVFYRNHTFYLYDSIMYSTGYSVQSNYLHIWKKYLMRAFDVSEDVEFIKDYNFVSDRENNGFDCYSCEITGGAVEVENRYAFFVQDQSVSFATDTIMMGVDNQNQYCWMWTIFYLLTKALRNKKYDWINFHKMIQNKNIIPVVFIKLFISLIIQMDSNFLSSKKFFIKYFNTVITNHSNYKDTFETSNDTFSLMKCPIGEEILSTKQDLNNLFDCVTKLYDIIYNDYCVLIPDRQIPFNDMDIVNRYVKKNVPGLLTKYMNNTKKIKDYNKFFAEFLKFYNKNQIEFKIDLNL